MKELLYNFDSRGVGTITLNRSKVHNAFDDKLIKYFNEVLGELENKNDIRVVVIKANGEKFSSGADLNWMKKMAGYSKDENIKDAKELANLMYNLNNLSKPTIAMVQGSAIGGGIGLISCCDIAIASSNATFCFSETKLGLIPAIISPYVIAAIGERAARRYFVTAENFDAKEAFRLGLIHDVVSLKDLETRLEYFISLILNNAPNATMLAKKLILDVARKEIDNALIDGTISSISNIRVSKEAQERIELFLKP